MKVELTKRELFVLEELLSDHASHTDGEDASFYCYPEVVLNHDQMESLWEKIVDARFTANRNGETW